LPNLFTLYFWLDPKVTKAQEPIKGDFAFGKPRTLFPLHAFIAGLTPFYFQSVFCIIEFSFHSILLSIPTIAIPLVAPPITADGFDLLFLNLFGGVVHFRQKKKDRICHNDPCSPSGVEVSEAKPRSRVEGSESGSFRAGARAFPLSFIPTFCRPKSRQKAFGL